MEDRTITFPAQVVTFVADRLMDLDHFMERDDAIREAFDIVIEVTEAVDKLRAIEARERGDVVESEETD